MSPPDVADDPVILVTSVVVIVGTSCFLHELTMGIRLKKRRTMNDLTNGYFMVVLFDSTNMRLSNLGSLSNKTYSF
jgi:high-affinity K+ transport system ATPase subunit B